MEFIELGPEQEEHFVDFPCARPRQDWTESSEYAIQFSLAWNLRAKRVRALGALSGDRLMGVLIWAPEVEDSRNWQCIVLGVRRGDQGRGIGRQLKEKLIELGRVEGIREINSLVHRENTDMLKLNRALDAVVVPDPDDSEGTNLICTIEVIPDSLST
jgi:GNAT superfamily N-acetyltransferase